MDVLEQNPANDAKKKRQLGAAMNDRKCVHSVVLCLIDTGILASSFKPTSFIKVFKGGSICNLLNKGRKLVSMNFKQQLVLWLKLG